MLGKTATATTKCTLVQSTTKVAQQRKTSSYGKSGVRNAQRQSVTKVRAAPIFEIAEETIEAVSETVSDTVSDAVSTVTVSPDVLDAYQSTAVSTVAQVNTTAAAAGDSGLSPLVLAGAAALVVGGPLLAFALRPGVKSISAAGAFNVLAETPSSVLIDLRPKAAVKADGSPDLRSIGGRKKYVKKPTDEEEFEIESFASIVANKEYVIFLDSYGGFAKKATQSLQNAKEIFDGEVAYVIDGTDGPAGWLNSDMPWKKPFSLSLPSVDELVENYKADPSPTNTAVTLLGGLGLASYVFVEYEGLVEFLSFFVGGSFLASKFLLAEDRETTNKQVMEFLNTKKAPEDLVKDIEDFKEKVVPEKAQVDEVPAVKAAEKKQAPAPVPTPTPTPAPAAKSEEKSLLKEFGLDNSAGAKKEEEPAESKEKSSEAVEVEKWISNWKAKTKDLQETG